MGNRREIMLNVSIFFNLFNLNAKYCNSNANPNNNFVENFPSPNLLDYMRNMLLSNIDRRKQLNSMLHFKLDATAPTAERDDNAKQR